jgi:hypothetical protein
MHFRQRVVISIQRIPSDYSRIALSAIAFDEFLLSFSHFIANDHILSETEEKE